MNTEFVTKSVSQVRKYRRSALGTTGFGISAAAVVWMYHTFVTIDQYRQDNEQLQQQIRQLWNAVDEKRNKP